MLETLDTEQTLTEERHRFVATGKSSAILVLFAHPAFERSRVNRHLADAVRDLPGITFHDLYEEYPDFEIDVAREQSLLLAHDGSELFLPWLGRPLLWAYDKATGEVLWEARLPAGGFATPSTYSVDGRQFVVIAAGGGKLGTASGSEYVAFGLPRAEGDAAAADEEAAGRREGS